MYKITTYTIAALALTACAIETTTEDEATTTQALLGCPGWGCGENSPVMGPYRFWEGNTEGLPNGQDIRFMNFQIGNDLYRPYIGSDSLVAYPYNSALPVKSGIGLQGGWFNVATPTGMYKIKILKVNPKATSTVMFWTGLAIQRIETYELIYTGPTGTTTNDRLCNNPPNGRDSGEGPGRLWNAPLEAMFFTGDRYKADTKEVWASTYASTAGWFNIACAGSALAKLHLNRFTTAGSTSLYTTTWQQRQALLKLYASDICGTGRAWTHAGTPLHWANLDGWSKLDGHENAFETRWSEKGALCLDSHRLGMLYADPADPNGIYGECKPPPCLGDVGAPQFPSGTHLVSAVPFAVP